ncbi:RDD family protein [Brachybacterium sp. DNPG3]
MIDRKDLGSWMEGAPGDPEYVRGAALGLPADGPGSVAGFGRRLLGLVIDWSLAVAASMLLFSYDSVATLSIFAALNLLFQTLFGATPGQFVLGLRVLPVRGRSPMIVRSLIRTALMLLVIPAVVWNRDRQPLHDVAAGTAVVRA